MKKLGVFCLALLFLAVVAFALDFTPAGNINMMGDLNIWNVRDINGFHDINWAGGIKAAAFFGDGSGLTGLSAVSDGFTATMDVNAAERAYLFGMDWNSTLERIADLNAFFYRKTDINAGWYGIVDVNRNFHSIIDLNLHYYKKADVNAHFVPYIGADFDVNLGTYDLNSFGKLQARKFVSTDANSVYGANAVALGYRTTAFGDYSTAMSYYATASGYGSTAMGYYITASGAYSIAMGYQTTASGNTSTAMGNQTIASGSDSIATGYLTRASGDYSTTMGSNTIASGNQSTAMGYLTRASGSNSTAIGKYSKAVGQGSLAAGYGDTEKGPFAIGDGAIALGYSDTNMVAGSTAAHKGAIALGYNTQSLAEAAITLGKNLTNYKANSVLVQDLNAANDINAKSITATAFFGDGSGLTGISGTGGTVTMDANVNEYNWLTTDLNKNYYGKLDVNTIFESKFDLNNFYYKKTDVNAGFYGKLDVNAGWYGKLDVNAHFAPKLNASFLGDTNALKFGAGNIFSTGVVRAGNLVLKSGSITDSSNLINFGDSTLFTAGDIITTNGTFTGDGSGLTDVSADVNGDDVNVNKLGIQGGLISIADANFLKGIKAVEYFGSGANLTGVLSQVDVNANFYGKLDVNAHFVPFIGATRDIDIGANALVASYVRLPSSGDVQWDEGGADDTILTISGQSNLVISGARDASLIFSGITADDRIYTFPNKDGNLAISNTDENFTAIQATAFFGSGAGLTGISGLPSDMNQAYYAQLDANRVLERIIDLNTFFYRKTDINAGWYGKLDVNTHFVPYIGAGKDVNLGIYNLKANDVNSVRLYSTQFFSHDANKAAGGLMAIGYNASAIGSNAIALGYGTTALANYCMAIGGNTTCSGQQAFAGGLTSIASGAVGFAFGDTAIASGMDSTAIGYHAQALASYSTSIGTNVINETANTVALGIDVNVARFLRVMNDVNVSAGINQGVSIHADVNRICFPSNSCEFKLDYNGTAMIFGS